MLYHSFMTSHWKSCSESDSVPASISLICGLFYDRSFFSEIKISHLEPTAVAAVDTHSNLWVFGKASPEAIIELLSDVPTGLKGAFIDEDLYATLCRMQKRNVEIEDSWQGDGNLNALLMRKNKSPAKPHGTARLLTEVECPKSRADLLNSAKKKNLWGLLNAEGEVVATLGISARGPAAVLVDASTFFCAKKQNPEAHAQSLLSVIVSDLMSGNTDLNIIVATRPPLDFDLQRAAEDTDFTFIPGSRYFRFS
jgi:hypothetical protein